MRTPGAGPPVLCLIGGMGSGKSRVAEELARRGGRVISGDRLGHEALRQPGIRARVVERWGPDVLDKGGNVSRRELGRRVFADPAELRALEAVVHPWIVGRIREEVAAARADPAVRLIVVDAAVLLEAGWDSCCEYVVFVHAPRAVRLRRLAEQRGWSEKEVDARARAQLSLTRKARRADFALDNGGPPEELGRRADEFLSRLPTTSCPPQAGGRTIK
jgi:dephospho-CoA kinase